MNYSPFKYWQEVSARKRARALYLQRERVAEDLLASLQSQAHTVHGPLSMNNNDLFTDSCSSSHTSRTDYFLHLSLPAYRHNDKADQKSDRSELFESLRSLENQPEHSMCHRCQKSLSSIGYGSACSCYGDLYSPALPVEESHVNICNIFWKSSLTFHPYRHGKPLVDFGSLWPDGNGLALLLLETYAAFGVNKSCQDLLLLVIRCGPIRVMKMMIQMSLVDINMRFDNGGGGMLHKSCIAQNIPAVLYLTSAGIDPAIQDIQGRTADQVCLSPQIKSALPDKYRPGSPKGKTRSLAMRRLTEVDSYSLPAVLAQKMGRPVLKKSLATEHDKLLIFDMAVSPKDTDELLIKLQSIQFDVNGETNDHGDYLVHVAVRQGLCQLPLLCLLQKLCMADIDKANTAGMTPLHIAAQSGDQVLVDSLLCVLGADPNEQHRETGWTALHYSCHSNNESVISTLIKRGADFNQEDCQGARPDDIAMLGGNEDSRYIIRMQRESRFLELVEKIYQERLTSKDLKRSDLYTTDNNGNTLIMIAAGHNKVKSLEALLADSKSPIDAQHEKTLKTALGLAASHGHCESIEILLKHGALATIKDKDGRLPLHDAVRGSHLEAVRLLTSDQSALVGLSSAFRIAETTEVRRELKAAMNRRQREIVTPALFECSLTGNAQKLFCLLEEGDNVNPTSSGGDWPLSLAVENGYFEVVQLLIQWGADYGRQHLTTRDTVLHIACARGHLQVLRFILEQIREKCDSSMTPLQIANALVNKLNLLRETPLIVAAEKGYSQAVRLLLQHGASSAVLDSLGQHLYQCQQFQGVQALLDQHRRRHTEAIMAAIRQRKGLSQLQAIFIPRFDHNLRDSSGNTPLMLACALGRREIVQMFLKSSTFSLVSSSLCSSLQSSSRYSDSNGDSELGHGISSVELHPDPLPSQRIHSHHTTEASRSEEPVQMTLDPNEMDIESAQDVLESYMEERGTVEPPGNSHEIGSPPDDGVLHNNIPTLLDSIVSLHSGSVYASNTQANHLCAIHPKDGGTAIHKLVESGDRVDILGDILDHDQSAINTQDKQGCSPLHLACKYGRKKCVEKLAALPYVDLNCRTLDGKLPEEMTTNQHLSHVIKSHREQKVSTRRSARPRFASFTGSLFNVPNAQSECESHMDFDKLNSRFLMMKQQNGDYDSFF